MYLAIQPPKPSQKKGGTWKKKTLQTQGRKTLRQDCMQYTVAHPYKYINLGYIELRTMKYMLLTERMHQYNRKPSWICFSHKSSILGPLWRLYNIEVSIQFQNECTSSIQYKQIESKAHVPHQRASAKNKPEKKISWWMWPTGKESGDLLEMAEPTCCEFCQNTQTKSKVKEQTHKRGGNSDPLVIAKRPLLQLCTSYTNNTKQQKAQPLKNAINMTAILVKGVEPKCNDFISDNDDLRCSFLRAQRGCSKQHVKKEGNGCNYDHSTYMQRWWYSLQGAENTFGSCTCDCCRSTSWCTNRNMQNKLR